MKEPGRGAQPPAGGKDQSAVIERRGGDRGAMSEAPVPDGLRRPRPVPMPTRDKEIADA